VILVGFESSETTLPVSRLLYPNTDPQGASRFG
jgi:hypothetical protein